jgi:hypothetical protein
MSGTEAAPAIQVVTTFLLLGVLGGLSWILVRPRIWRARRRHAINKTALAALPPAYRPRRPPAREAAIMVPLLLGSVLLVVLKPHPATFAVGFGVMVLSMTRRERIERRHRRWIRADLLQHAASLEPDERAALTTNLQRVYTPHDFRELTRGLPHELN